MLFKSEPTKSEKAKGAALAAVGLATTKAAEAKVKTEKDIVPTLAEKAEEARDFILEKADEAREAAAPHVEKVADATADQREAAADKVSVAKAAAAAKLSDVADSAADARKDAQKKADKKSSRFVKQADKRAAKAQKKADKKASAIAAFLGAKAADGEKKATKTFGVDARQDVAYKAAALRGQAQQVAEDKGLTADNARDFYKDELLPHLKEILATAAAAGTAASHNVVGQLPDGAQDQVARYAPALAPKKKKKGGFLMVVGAAALAGAAYLVYADQQKKSAKNAQLSEASIADSQAARGDEMTINNPVTNFKQADDTTMVRPVDVNEPTAEPAGGPGTAATWTDSEKTGHMDVEGLEGETRSSRRAARGDH